MGALPVVRDVESKRRDGGGRPHPELVRSALDGNLPAALGARLTSARDLARRHRRTSEAAPRPTHLAPLDRLLGGGLVPGRLTEIVGRPGSGRFAAVLAALAAVTGTGEAAALVDLGDGLDPGGARAAGVDLERLLWLRPRRTEEAMAAAEAVLATGFPLVVVDLGQPPVPGGRGAQGAWLRLARAARDQGGALLVAAPYRVSGPAASTVLTAGRGRAAWGGPPDPPREEVRGARRGASATGRSGGGAAGVHLLTGLAARLELEKRRGAAPGETAALPLDAAESLLAPSPFAADEEGAAEAETARATSGWLSAPAAGEEETARTDDEPGRTSGPDGEETPAPPGSPRPGAEIPKPSSVPPRRRGRGRGSRRDRTSPASWMPPAAADPSPAAAAGAL